MYVEVRDCSNDMRSNPITIEFELIQTNLFVLSALRFHNFYLPTSGL